MANDLKINQLSIFLLNNQFTNSVKSEIQQSHRTQVIFKLNVSLAVLSS